MPRCKLCKKKFAKISDLREHHRAAHPNTRFEAPESLATRNLLVALIIVIIVVGSAVGLLILWTPSNPQTVTTQASLLGQALPSSFYANITSISDSTLSSVGKAQGVTAPTSISGGPLLSGGKPEVLYVGSEYCPYCAAETWALIIALSRFGSFTNLHYMLSGANDVYASTPTFTFYKSQYSSQYISFVSVEEQDRDRNALENLTSQQSALLQQYDSCNPGCSIPFIDIANKYTVVGAQYTPSTLSGLDWNGIAAQLKNPNSPVTKGILGAANYLISAICSADGGQPSTVCGQSYANLVALYVSQSSSSSFSMLVSTQRIASFQERKAS